MANTFCQCEPLRQKQQQQEQNKENIKIHFNQILYNCALLNINASQLHYYKDIKPTITFDTNHIVKLLHCILYTSNVQPECLPHFVPVYYIQ